MGPHTPPLPQKRKTEPQRPAAPSPERNAEPVQCPERPEASPVGFRTTIWWELVRASWDTGSIAWQASESPGGGRVKLRIVRSLKRSFLPLAGHRVSWLGLSSSVRDSGAFWGSQKARSSCTTGHSVGLRQLAGALGVPGDRVSKGLVRQHAGL